MRQSSQTTNRLRRSLYRDQRGMVLVFAGMGMLVRAEHSGLLVWCGRHGRHGAGRARQHERADGRGHADTHRPGSGRPLGRRNGVGGQQPVTESAYRRAPGLRRGRVHGRIDIQIPNFVGFFIENLQGKDVVGRVVPMTGFLHGGTAAPAGAFLRAIRLVQ